MVDAKTQDLFVATDEVTVDAVAAEAIRRGIAAADEDRVVPAGDVKKLVSQWTSKFSTPIQR